MASRAKRKRIKRQMEAGEIALFLRTLDEACGKMAASFRPFLNSINQAAANLAEWGKKRQDQFVEAMRDFHGRTP